MIFSCYLHASRISYRPEQLEETVLLRETLVGPIHPTETRLLPIAASTFEKADQLPSHVPVDLVELIGSVSRSEVADFPDRIIAGTALHLGLPLITRDGKIRASSVTTIW